MHYCYMKLIFPCQVLWTTSENCKPPWDLLNLLLIHKQVEIAISERSVDKGVLFRVAGGRIGCAIVARIIRHFMYRLQRPLNNSIKQYYSVQVFRSMARLDLPTFVDPAVQRQTEAAWSASGQSSVAWDTINMVAGLISTVIRLISQVSAGDTVSSGDYARPPNPQLFTYFLGLDSYQYSLQPT